MTTIAEHRAASSDSMPRLRPRLADVRSFVRLGILASALGLLFWGTAPYALGWRATMITSDSMTPAIRQGDLVVVAPADPVTARTAELHGAVIQVDNPARPGELLVHRVVHRDADGALITKGDANASADYSPVPPSAVRGIARLRIPMAGLPVLWMQRGQLVPLAAFGLALLVVIWPERRRPAAPQGAPTPPAATT